MERQIKPRLTMDSLQTDTRWKKYSLDANFVDKVQKNLSSIFTEKAPEAIKNAINELKKHFTDKYAVASWKEQRTLISLFGLVCKYLRESFSSEEALERIHLVRGSCPASDSICSLLLKILWWQNIVLINTAIAISKEENFRNSALWKINNHVPYSLLFKTFGDNIEFLRSVANFFILRPRFASTNEDPEIVDVLMKQLPIVDPTTQGCLVAAGTAIVVGSYRVSSDPFYDVAIQLLDTPDPSLGKLMVALCLPAKQVRGQKKNRVTLDHESDFIKVLADYVKWCSEYEESVKESSLNVCLMKRIASRVIEDLKGHEQSFLEQSINNLKQMKNESAMHYAVELLVYFVFFEPHLPGTQVIDLPDMLVTVLKELVTIDRVWSNQQVCGTLAKFNLPSTRDAMVQFIQNTKSECPKRFPTFETMLSVPWSTLNHAYGTAESTPKLLYRLASWDSETRKGAFSSMRNGITHQGNCYEATPYIVPFLLELAEGTFVQDRPRIMEYCTWLLTDDYNEYFLAACDLDLERVFQPYPQVLQIRLAIAAKFTENLQIIISLISNECNQVRGWAVFLLGLLPKSAHESVPKLQERYQAETDSKVKASILLSISLLWFDLEDKEQESIIEFFKREYDKHKDTEDLDIEFAAFACLVRHQYECLEGEFGKNMKDQFRKILKESDDASFKRANYAIQIPKEFVLRNILDYCMAEMLPLVIEQVQSDEYKISSTAVEIMFRLAFQRFWNWPHKYRMHSEVSSKEMITVVTTAMQYFIDSHTSNWTVQQLGLPYDKETCQEYLEEARVIEDLYGYNGKNDF